MQNTEKGDSIDKLNKNTWIAKRWGQSEAAVIWDLKLWYQLWPKLARSYITWSTNYRIAQNFDGGFDVFDAFQLDRQNLTRQIIYKNNTAFTGVWWKAGTICQNIFIGICINSMNRSRPLKSKTLIEHTRHVTYVFHVIHL